MGPHHRLVRAVDGVRGEGDLDYQLDHARAASMRCSHKIAIGFTGEPVASGSRSGAITHKNDQRSCCSHNGTTSSNCR
jgi:hypothetical protein